MHQDQLGPGDAPTFTLLGADVTPMPAPPRAPKRPPCDPHKLADFAARWPGVVTLEWLAARSPVPVPAKHERGVATAAAFLSALYAGDDRVLVFTRQFSQGDFLFEPARGAFRLAAAPAVRAVPSPLPAGAPGGVWWLVQPVHGDWLPNANNRDRDGNVQLGRRHAACVSRWPFLVLESDEAPADLRLRALVQLPVAGIRSSSRFMVSSSRTRRTEKPSGKSARRICPRCRCAASSRVAPSAPTSASCAA